MVQTNQMINSLNTTVSMQNSGKTVKNDDSKSSFSQVLDQEISSSDKAQADDAAASQKTEANQKPKDPEAQEQDAAGKVLEDAEQQTEQTTTVDPTWLMQNLVVQQPVAEDTAEVITAAEEGLVQTEELVQPIVEEQDAAAEMVQAVETVVQAEPEVQTQDAVQTTQQGIEEAAEPILKADEAVQAAISAEEQADSRTQASGAAQNQPVQTQQVSQTEAAGAAEAAVQNVQPQPVQQTVVETVQPQQPQTIDMRSPQEGIQNLAKNMAEQIMQGKNTMEFWLEPADLGKIGVKVVYEGGRALISILCMSDKAMELVAQNAKTLGAIVQQNTGTNTLVVVEQPEQQDYLQQEADRNNGGDGQQEEQDGKDQKKDPDADAQSFLQQLRLGLA